ncbi:MAG TPA: hypothetical protein VKC60_00370 [Opitutaceae bacterium]|nr:hypothetical protein [Opitutaceae bacterium]
MTEPSSNNEEAEIEILAPSALESIQRAEVDMSIATAKKYKRDVASAIKTVRELALRNPRIAERCNYALPRAGKKIIGPSVHFARIVAHAWGNLRCGSRVIGCDRENAHMQGVCHDLETNVAITTEMDWPVQAPKTDTDERWKDQMNLAKRGGAAVAFRNAIFDALPMILFEDIAEEAKLIAVGEGKTFEERRANCIAEFRRLGVSQQQIYKLLERGGLESITTDDLIYLHGILTSIRDNTMTVAQVFPPEAQTVKAQVPKAKKEEPPPVPPEKGAELARKMKDELASASQKEEPTTYPKDTLPQVETKKPEGETKPLEKEPPPAAKESSEPFPEPKPAAPKKKAAPPPTAASKPANPSDAIRERLGEAKVSESELVAWLNDIGTVPHGTTSLDQVNTKWLKMVLDDWDGILEQVRTFLDKMPA